MRQAVFLAGSKMTIKAFITHKLSGRMISLTSLLANVGSKKVFNILPIRTSLPAVVTRHYSS